MSLTEMERQELIQYRIAEAKDTELDIELLISNNRLRAAINRIYYSMFYSLLALGLKYKFETSKHAQLIGWFNKNFINTGLIDAKFGRVLNKAFNRRTKGDYDSFVEFEHEIVLEMFDEAKEFNRALEQFIKESIHKSD